MLFESFTKNFDPAKMIGMRLGAIGLLIAAVGFIVRIANNLVLGEIAFIKTFSYFTACIGIWIGLIGGIVHFWIMLFRRK